MAVTAPFLHSGAYDDLADVVRHHLDPQTALAEYDPSGVPDAESEDFEANTAEMLEALEASARVIPFYASPFAYTDQDVDDLVAFLETLTDPCVTDRECLDPWVADPETDDVDGTLLVAVDGDGNPL